MKATPTMARAPMTGAPMTEAEWTNDGTDRTNLVIMMTLRREDTDTRGGGHSTDTTGPPPPFDCAVAGQKTATAGRLTPASGAFTKNGTPFPATPIRGSVATDRTMVRNGGKK